MIFPDVSIFISVHCVKSVRIRSYSGPYFPAFGLSTERYFCRVYLRFFQKMKETTTITKTIKLIRWKIFDF